MTSNIFIDNSVLIETYKGNRVRFYKSLNILQEFIFLPGNQGFLSEVPRLMAKYNLLPYDATILATCKPHGTKLPSQDSDFIFCCEEENIELIRDI